MGGSSTEDEGSRRVMGEAAQSTTRDRASMYLRAICACLGTKQKAAQTASRAQLVQGACHPGRRERQRGSSAGSQKLPPRGGSRWLLGRSKDNTRATAARDLRWTSTHRDKYLREQLTHPLFPAADVCSSRLFLTDLVECVQHEVRSTSIDGPVLLLERRQPPEDVVFQVAFAAADTNAESTKVFGVGEIGDNVRDSVVSLSRATEFGRELTWPVVYRVVDNDQSFRRKGLPEQSLPHGETRKIHVRLCA